MSFIIKNLLLIHQGPLIAKIKATLLLSVAASPIMFLMEKAMEWYTLNIIYISFVFIAVFADHILGTWVHALIKRDFSFKKNIWGLFTKTSLVIIVGVLVEGFKHILGPDQFLTDYFNLICRTMVFIYPTGSALVNSAIITNGTFPPTSFMEKLGKFNKEMDLDIFKKKKEDKE